MSTRKPSADRRDFLKATAVAAGAATAAGLAPTAFAAGNDVIKVGLIGCGGRGRGAAAQSISSSAGVKLHAMGDMFPDHLRNTLDDLKKDYGSSYRNMMVEVKTVMENAATLFPALQGKKPRLAGFVWFQGWNDQYGAENEYASNLKHFIRDVRKDLAAPDLPFVIAAMGQNGSKPAKGAMLTIQRAQLAMNDVPEFKGNVKTFRTDVLVDKAAEELYPTWEKNVEQWKLIGGDHGYHYLGSAIWFTRIGHAMGDAMRELIATK